MLKMSIEKMELVNITGTMSDLDNVLLKCCQSGCFHMETASQAMDSDSGFTALDEQNPYVEPLKRLYALAGSLSYTLKGSDKTDSPLKTLDELSVYVDSTEEKFRALNEKISALSEQVSLKEQALIQLYHLKGINVDFRQIFSCEYVKVRFGKLPTDSLKKLAYYEDKLFFFLTFDNDKEYCWGVYFVPVSHATVVDNIFESLYFERVRIPDFVEGTGETALEDVTESLNKDKEELSACREKLSAMMEEEKSGMDTAFSRLKFLHDTFELRRNVSIANEKFYLVGFVPECEAKKFLAGFEDLKDVSVLLNPPEVDERFVPPVKLKNNKFAKPFSMFVEMYGLPSYHGYNPTTFVAITYTLLFGVMFGDLGQGIVIAIVGALLWKLKKFQLGQIMTRLGISSAIFGLVYGSVFGFEEVLNPLYKALGFAHKPLEVFESTNTILVGAVAIGIVLIIAAIILNIGVSLKNKNYESALFGNNGFAGLIFYGSVLVAGVSTLVLGVNLFTPLYVIGLIVLPLIAMFFRTPLGNLMKGKKPFTEGIGNFIAENFFELFEYLLSYVTNTLSFLRVGGFVLSHAGMMLVVMTLAEGAAAGASPVIIIIGNIFVMGLEGLIVGIQVLRLEFYEMFSKFYEADGHPFTPVKVNYSSEIE